jgi:endonuclease/exonuclease/phosphatase family metal-dependent hydrolase
MRILTANLLNGRAHPEVLAARLEALHVDVAVFQELGPTQAGPIGEVLPCGKLEPSADFHGMGIALARPGEVRRLPLPRRDARVAELHPADWPELGAAAEVINLHVLAPHATWPWQCFDIRGEQVERTLAYVEATPRAHRVVAGDFNATPLWPVYRRLARRFRDVAAEGARGRGHRAPLRTWGPWPGSPRLLRIDHVLAAGFTVHHFERLELPGTDHSAVLLELTPGRGAAAGA